MQRVLQVPFNGRPSLLSCLAKKGRSVGNTRLSPHAKNAACSNELFSLSSRLCFGGKRFDWANVNFGCLLNIFHTERSWHAYWFSLVGMICPLMQEHFLSWPLSKSKALYCGWLRVLGCFISPDCLLDLNNFKRFSLCPWMWLFAAMFCHAKAQLVSFFSRILNSHRYCFTELNQQDVDWNEGINSSFSIAITVHCQLACSVLL